MEKDPFLPMDPSPLRGVEGGVGSDITDDDDDNINIKDLVDEVFSTTQLQRFDSLILSQNTPIIEQIAEKDTKSHAYKDKNKDISGKEKDKDIIGESKDDNILGKSKESIKDKESNKDISGYKNKDKDQDTESFGTYKDIHISNKVKDQEKDRFGTYKDMHIVNAVKDQEKDRSGIYKEQDKDIKDIQKDKVQEKRSVNEESNKESNKEISHNNSDNKIEKYITTSKRFDVEVSIDNKYNFENMLSKELSEYNNKVQQQYFSKDIALETSLPGSSDDGAINNEIDTSQDEEYIKISRRSKRNSSNFETESSQDDDNLYNNSARTTPRKKSKDSASKKKKKSKDKEKEKEYKDKEKEKDDKNSKIKLNKENTIYKENTESKVTYLNQIYKEDLENRNPCQIQDGKEIQYIEDNTMNKVIIKNSLGDEEIISYDNKGKNKKDIEIIVNSDDVSTDAYSDEILKELEKRAKDESTFINNALLNISKDISKTYESLGRDYNNSITESINSLTNSPCRSLRGTPINVTPNKYKRTPGKSPLRNSSNNSNNSSPKVWKNNSLSPNTIYDKVYTPKYKSLSDSKSPDEEEYLEKSYKDESMSIEDLEHDSLISKSSLDNFIENMRTETENEESDDDLDLKDLDIEGLFVKEKPQTKELTKIKKLQIDSYTPIGHRTRKKKIDFIFLTRGSKKPPNKKRERESIESIKETNDENRTLNISQSEIFIPESSFSDSSSSDNEIKDKEPKIINIDKTVVKNYRKGCKKNSDLCLTLSNFNNDLAKEIKEQRHKVLDSETEVMKRKIELNEANSKIKELEKSVENLESKNKEYISTITLLNKDNKVKELEKKVANLENTNKDLTSNIDSLKQELKEAQEKYRKKLIEKSYDHEKEKDKLQKNYKDQKDRLDKDHREAIEYINREHGSNIEGMRTKLIEDLKNKFASCEECENHKKQINRLKKQFIRYKDMVTKEDKSMDDLKSKIDEKSKEVISISQKFLRSEKNLELANERINEMDILLEQDQLNNSNVLVPSNSNKQKSEIKELSRAMEVKENIIKTMERQKDNLQRELESERKKLEELQKSKDDLDQQIKNLQSQLFHSKENKEQEVSLITKSKDKEIANLQNLLLESYEKENSEDKTKITELNTRIKSLEEDIKNSKEKETNIESLKQTIFDKEKEVDAIQKKLDEANILVKEHDEIKAEVEDLRKRIAKFDDNDNDQSTLYEKQLAWEKEEENYKDEIKVHKQREIRNTTTVKCLRDEISTLTKEKRTLKSKLSLACNPSLLKRIDIDKIDENFPGNRDENGVWIDKDENESIIKEFNKKTIKLHSLDYLRRWLRELNDAEILIIGHLNSRDLINKIVYEKTKQVALFRFMCIKDIYNMLKNKRINEELERFGQRASYIVIWLGQHDIQFNNESAFNTALQITKVKENLESLFNNTVLVVNIPEMYKPEGIIFKYRNANGMLRKLIRRDEIIDVMIWLGEPVINPFNIFYDGNDTTLSNDGLKKVTEGILNIIMHLKTRKEALNNRIDSNRKEKDQHKHDKKDENNRYTDNEGKDKRYENNSKDTRQKNENYKKRNQDRKNSIATQESQESQESQASSVGGLNININAKHNGKSILGDYETDKQDKDKKDEESKKKENNNTEKVKVKPTTPRQRNNNEKDMNDAVKKNRERNVVNKRMHNNNKVISDIDNNMSEDEENFDSFLIPGDYVGLIIGSKGGTLNRIMDETSCYIWVDDKNSDRNGFVPVIVRGDNIRNREKAYKMVRDKIKNSMMKEKYDNRNNKCWDELDTGDCFNNKCKKDHMYPKNMKNKKERNNKRLNEAFTEFTEESSSDDNGEMKSVIIPLSGQKYKRKKNNNRNNDRSPQYKENDNQKKKKKGKFERGVSNSSDSESDIDDNRNLKPKSLFSSNR